MTQPQGSYNSKDLVHFEVSRKWDSTHYVLLEEWMRNHRVLGFEWVMLKWKWPSCRFLYGGVPMFLLFEVNGEVRGIKQFKHQGPELLAWGLQGSKPSGPWSDEHGGCQERPGDVIWRYDRYLRIYGVPTEGQIMSIGVTGSGSSSDIVGLVHDWSTTGCFPYLNNRNFENFTHVVSSL